MRAEHPRQLRAASRFPTVPLGYSPEAAASYSLALLASAGGEHPHGAGGWLITPLHPVPRPHPSQLSSLSAPAAGVGEETLTPHGFSKPSL